MASYRPYASARPFLSEPAPVAAAATSTLDELIFRNPKDLIALSNRPLFKTLYILTAVSIVLGTLAILITGMSLWGDRKLKDNEPESTNTVIVLSWMAIPVGLLFYMGLQNIRDSIGLFFILFGFTLYVTLFAMRVQRAL